MYGFIYEIAMKIIYYWYIIGQISVPEIMKKYILRIFYENHYNYHIFWGVFMY